MTATAPRRRTGRDVLAGALAPPARVDGAEHRARPHRPARRPRPARTGHRRTRPGRHERRRRARRSDVDALARHRPVRARRALRTLNGGRYALSVTFLATTIAVAVGTVLGCVTAYADNWFDEVVMRVVDALLSVPSILALLVVVTVFDAGLWVIVLAVTVVYAPAVTRVVRGAARTVITQDYVTAARARGERPLSIVFREILPNVLDVVLVEYAMRASWIVLLVASLSFLGFGANPRPRTGA
ncbi:ABC transporter permease [Curtobacterium flaccumfaciens]|nr:ABC transporter permease [Curtobacterium flaccumfaciens]